MKPKDFLLSMILIVALSAFGISSGVASDKNEAKHSGKITKARAERIALTKVPGGSIRSAELETTRGQRFWSVYIAKPGSKNAKEIRIDATSGQILLCKRKDQKIRPKNLQKTIKRLGLAAKVLIDG
jgi:Peptidase propeptide and YPEB domain